MKSTKKSKRKIPNLNISVNGAYQLDCLLDHPDFNRVIFNEIVTAVKEGIENKKSTVTLFEINESGFVVDLDKENWNSSLDSAISFFEKQENYEKCHECSNLKNQINGVI
jgi:hypothetical protein